MQNFYKLEHLSRWKLGTTIKRINERIGCLEFRGTTIDK